MNKIDKTIYNNLDLLPEDLTGWNGSNKIFGQLIDEVKPRTIIEVGTWKGLSAINMGRNVKEQNLNTKIFCVDTWLGAIEFWGQLSQTPERNLLLKNGYPQIYYQFLSNVVHNKLEDYILPIPNTSENGFRYLKYLNIRAEMIYIDASHEEDDVYKDLSNYYELLENNGIMFGDDYQRSWPGVINSVNRFSKEKNIELEIIDNNFWVLKNKKI
jgi:hypothetical protein